VRGRHGGIRLGRAAEEITLLDVVRLTEENFALAECFEGGDVNCPLISNCDLNAALGEALGAFFSVLESYSVADLADKKRFLRARLGLGIEELVAVN
jgi:Rrf2 family iron-responsive transcriptional regulator